MTLVHPEPALFALLIFPGILGLLGLGIKHDTQKGGKKVKQLKKTAHRLRNGRGKGERPAVNPATIPPIPRWPRAMFWASMAAAALASFGHVSHLAGRVEPAGPFPLLYQFSAIASLLTALAIDMALFTVTWHMGRARRYNLPTGRMWTMIVFLAALSVFANAAYAFETLLGGPATVAGIAGLDPYDVALAITLSATLPMILIGLNSVSEEVGVEYGSVQTRRQVRAPGEGAEPTPPGRAEDSSTRSPTPSVDGTRERETEGHDVGR